MIFIWANYNKGVVGCDNTIIALKSPHIFIIIVERLSKFLNYSQGIKENAQNILNRIPKKIHIKIARYYNHLMEKMSKYVKLRIMVYNFKLKIPEISKH